MGRGIVTVCVATVLTPTPLTYTNISHSLLVTNKHTTSNRIRSATNMCFRIRLVAVSLHPRPDCGARACCDSARSVGFIRNTKSTFRVIDLLRCNGREEEYHGITFNLNWSNHND